MFSPPPMDGFSPPPMSDFSPPPMEDISPLNDFSPPLNGFSPPPDVEDVNDENDFDFGISDTAYDLTGLSDKIDTLELDKINTLPPREILELKKESSELNNLYSNNLKVELDTSENVLKCENNNPVRKSDNVQSSEENESSDYNHVNDAFSGCERQSEIDTTQQLQTSLSDTAKMEECEREVEIEDLKGTKLEHLPQASVDPEVPIEEHIYDNHLSSRHIDDIFNEESLNDSSELQLPISDIDEPSQSAIIPEILDQEATASGNEDDWSYFPDESKMVEIDPWANSQPEADNCENWGDFGGSTVNASSDDRTTVNLDKNPELDNDYNSDDEFGDFGEANAVSSINSVLEVNLSHQLEKLDGIGENLINTVFGGVSKVASSEKNTVELSLEEDVLKDEEIFKQIENPALTPSIEYKWIDSTTYAIILGTLGIDSRVVLDGENWRSSVPRYAPKTAATLLTPGLLTPEQVSSPTDKSEDQHQEEKDDLPGANGVNPAEFDWNNSGLTNPLEENGLTDANPPKCLVEKPKVITEILAEQNSSLTSEMGLTILQKHTSREAKNIIDGFPLLNFMTSSVLMFPTKSIDKRGKLPPD